MHARVHTRHSFCCASVSLCLDALLPSLECSSPLWHHAFGGGEHLARSRHHPSHAVAPSCRCAAGVLPFSTRLEEEPTGGQKRAVAVPECCMQSAPWKVDRPMMPAGLARMHVHDIVTTDERARQGHPRGR